VNFRYNIGVLLASLGCLASPAVATTPLFDWIEVEGQGGNLHQRNKVWLDLPRSERLQEIRRSEWCSAIGGPRGKYRIEDGKLWLYALYRCGGNIELREVYPDQHQSMLATWITGDLVAEVGKPLCRSRKGDFSIYATEISFNVVEGTVTSLQSKSNAGHPDCRTTPSSGH
jgi:hypothetical protein